MQIEKKDFVSRFGVYRTRNRDFFVRITVLSLMMLWFAMPAVAVQIGTNPGVPASFTVGPSTGTITTVKKINQDDTLSFNFDIQVEVTVEFLANSTVVHTTQFIAHSGTISSTRGDTRISHLKGATNIGPPDILGTLQVILPSGVNNINEKYSGIGTPNISYVKGTLSLDSIPDFSGPSGALAAGAYSLTFETILGNLMGTAQVGGTIIGGTYNGTTAPAVIGTVSQEVPAKITFPGAPITPIGAGDTFSYSATYTAQVTGKNTQLNPGIYSGSFENPPSRTLNLDSDVEVEGDFINYGTLIIRTDVNIVAGQFINGSSTTLIVDGATLTITTDTFINNLYAQVHINGGGTIKFAMPPGETAIQVNNAGIINIGASASPGSPGNGTLRPDSASDSVHLLNTGVINIGSASTVGSLGTTTEPLASLNNVGLAPVTGTGSIIVSDATTAAPPNDNVIAVRGDWLSAGTFIAGDSTLTLSGAGVLVHNSINGFNNLTISGGTHTLGSKLMVNGDFIITAGAKLMVGSNNININGPTTISGRMQATGGTQTYAQDFTVDVNAIYDNDANNVTLNINAPFTNNGIAILGSGTINSQSITNSGQLTASSGNLRITGDFINSGTFNHNNGTIIFTDGGTFDTGGETVIYNNITKTGLGTTTTLGDALTMIGSFIIESGRFDADVYDITVAGNVSAGGNGLDIDGADLILNPPTGTTQTFDPGTSASVYRNIIKQGGCTLLINNHLVLSGNFLVNTGTFQICYQNLMVGASLTISDTATLVDCTGTITVNGDTTIDGTLCTSGVATHRFASITVSINGIYDNDTNDVTVSATGTVTNDGTMTMGTGEVDFTSGLNNSNIFTSTPGSLRIIGNMTNTGTFKHNGGMVIFGGDGIFNPGLSIYNNITKAGAGTTTTLGEDLTLLGTLTVDAGTMALGAHTVSLGTVYIGGNGILTQDADGLLSVLSDFTNSGVYAPDVASTLSLTGTGTLTPGISDFRGTLLTSGAITLAEDSIFNFAGANWTNTGTFDTGTNTTVRFNRSGNQMLTTRGAPNLPAMNFVNIETDNDDTITFATAINLSGTLTIAGGATVRDVTPGSVYNFADTARLVVSGILNLTGSPADHIQLLGSGGGEGSARWTFMLNSSGTVYLNHVDLRDSELITHGGSLNGKNVGYTVVSLGNLSPSWGPYDPVPAPYIKNTITPNKAQPGTKGLLVTLAGGNFSADTTVSFGDGITVVSLDASGAPTTLGATIDVAADAQLGSRTIKVTNPDGEYTSKTNVFTISDEVLVAYSTIAGDANADWRVDLVDFSILASAFGTSDERADFDGDGFVNLPDFSILAANFGKTTNDLLSPRRDDSTMIPAGHLSLNMPTKIYRGDVVEATVMAENISLKAYTFTPTYDSSMLKLMEDGIVEGDFLKDSLFVAIAGEDAPLRIFSATRSKASEGTGMLTKLRFRVMADGVSNNAIALRDVQIVDGLGRFSHLPEIHAAFSTVPHKTRLLANYPNPFNPETWIPFELADGANVKLRIYDVSGRLVRTLDLGYRHAGRYVDQSMAAYWDGRSSSGERVASGIYLYSLTAGEFSAIRRMLILK